MQLIDVINGLKDTYNSIDVRIFSFLQNTAWYNIFTIIRFRKETVKELKQSHDQLIEKCGGLIQTDEFRIDLFQFPIQKWQIMTENLSNKFLCLTDNFAVNYFDPIQFSHTVTEPYLDSSRDHVFKIWKIFSGYSETSHSSRPSYHDKLFENALQKRFTHFDDYLSTLLEFDSYDFQRNPWVYTFVPVFFKIDDVEFNHDKVIVKFTTYPRENLELTFNFLSTARNYKGEFIDKKTKRLELTGRNELLQRETIIDLDTRSLGNDFELFVTRNSNILIEKMKDKIKNRWKDSLEFTSPFHFVFQKYVDFDKLQKMLIECESIDYKDPGKVFERGVSWLLTLLGIQNILMGSYERINEGSNLVSTDILGNLNKNDLLLVNVTAAFPRSSDFDKEKEYRENLLKLIKNNEVDVKSVYFTSKEPTESEAAAKSNGVLLIGRSKLKIILDHLKKGELEEARKVIQNSEF